jgi:hypothetical protein
MPGVRVVMQAGPEDDEEEEWEEVMAELEDPWMRDNGNAGVCSPQQSTAH